MKKFFKIFLFTFLFLDLLAVNLLLGFIFYRENSIDDNESTTNLQISDTTKTENASYIEKDCSEDCREYTDEKISEVLSILKEVKPTTVAPKTIIPVNTVFKNVSYIPIPGSGSTTNTVWTDVAGSDFYFTKRDYVGFKESYFEVNMRLQNGNGMGYVRLYDVTNNRAVDASEVSTASQTSVFVSSKNMSIWEGFNHYKVQVKSLTVDTTYFESGRIKIINEN